MALHRVRAHLRFTTVSGLATWCRDNMAVRYTAAVSVNAEAANAEIKRNEIVSEGATQRFRCDLPLLDSSHAADAYNTLSAIIGQTQAIPASRGTRRSWLEHHTCDHADSTHSGCARVSFTQGPA